MVSIDTGSSGVALRPHIVFVDAHARTPTVVAVPKGMDGHENQQMLRPKRPS
jgi:hypothetical protein